MALPIFRVSSRGEKGRRRCVLAKKCAVVDDDDASWRKNALSSPTTVRVGEKTCCRRRRRCFLTKKRAVVDDDSASWRKNASSSIFFQEKSWLERKIRTFTADNLFFNLKLSREYEKGFDN
jgi:hypothetical protein